MPPIRTIVVFLAASLLTACGSAQDDFVPVAIIDSSEAPFSRATGGKAAMALAAATGEGLVALDSYGRIVPALADRWIVTDDGTSYIFRLRDGLWRDGSEIDAQNARAALSAAIRRQRGTALGADLGKIAQVRAMAGRVLEIRLNQPSPDLLVTLARPELGLLRGGVGAGPMDSTVEGKSALLRPIPPAELGLPSEEGWADRARAVQLLAMPAQAAIEAFAQGDVRVVLGGTVADLLLTDRTGLSRGALRVEDVEGLLGFGFTHRDGFFGSAENRAALAMAIDREALFRPFGIADFGGRLSALPDEGPNGRPLPIAKWRDLSLEDRRASARSRVSQWKAQGNAVSAIRIALPSGPGGDRLFEGVARDFEAIGLDAERVAPEAKADLVLLDEVAPNPDLEWYLNRFRCGLRTRICIEEVDDLVAEARKSDPRASRVVLLDEAAALVEAQQIFIALGDPIRWSLVGGGVTGFQPNALGVHPLMELAMRPR